MDEALPVAKWMVYFPVLTKEIYTLYLLETVLRNPGTNSEVNMVKNPPLDSILVIGPVREPGLS